jgi:hypothetical protein
MIIIEIGRGLGNSMYVYAGGKVLAKHLGTELKLDTSYIDAWPKTSSKFGGEWDVVIEKFNISSKRATKKEVRKFLFRTGFRPLDRILFKLKLFERNVVKFSSSDSVENFYKIPDDTYLIAYLGQDKFFNQIKKLLQKEFTLKEEYKKNIEKEINKIKSENSVSIHVRRGDLLNLKNCHVLEKEYYRKAIELTKKKIKNPVFYVFSDGVEWCKKNFADFGVELNFVQGHEDYEDFELMKSCKNNILANSSFSWWAGYLNSNPDKVVIAPEHFSMFKDIKTPDLPKGWITVSHNASVP